MQFVEQDQYCQRVLSRHWPGVPIHDDIKSFTGISFRGRVDIIFGGFPCQDISVCNPDGKGLEGNRSGLWFEMLRVVEGVRPAWVVVENVPNLINLGIDVCILGLENLGYGTTTIDFPASGVGACHRRYRVAIVAYDPSCRWVLQEHQTETGWRQSPRSYRKGIGPDDSDHHHPSGKRRSNRPRQNGATQPEQLHAFNSSGGRCEGESRRWSGSLVTDGYVPLRQDFWWEWPTQPLLRRGDDGFPTRVDRARGISSTATPRQAFEMRIKGLGNAVCPQQFFPIFDSIYRHSLNLCKETT